MSHLFVDTFYLIALSNHHDAWHEHAVALSRSLTDYRLYTVDEVLAEFLTFCRTAAAHIRTYAARTVRQALHDPQWLVLPQSRTSLLEALTLYESRPGKAYSLTNCVSMNVMQREGLTDVLTNDHHFTQEGFQILFR
jgi:uncharacterized protein